GCLGVGHERQDMARIADRAAAQGEEGHECDRSGADAREPWVALDSDADGGAAGLWDGWRFAVQGANECRRVRESVGGRETQGAEDRALERRWDVAAFAAWRLGRRQESVDRETAEPSRRDGRLADQGLVEDAGERVEIAARVRRVAARLLGTHGRRRPEPDARRLQRRITDR